MSFQSACEEWDARQRAEQIWDTFGHLAPKKGKKYRGKMLYATGCYRDTIIIKSEFDELESSPWRYQAEHDYAYENGQAAGVYLFIGYICVSKNNDVILIGESKRIPLEEI
jgi:hypothetical protein